MNSVVWLVVSLQIWNSNNADVLLDSGLNLFDIIANLCSKLHYEVLLKSGNYIVYLLKWTSALDFNKRGCVRQIWVDWSSLLILPTHALNYCVQKWKKCIEYLGIRLIVFRTWIIRQCNPVWVHKLTDIITSLVFMNWALSQQKHDTCIWN